MFGDVEKAFGDSINSILGNQYVQVAIQAIIVYIILVWLLTAFWAFRDMQHRTTNPVAPYLAAGLSSRSRPSCSCSRSCCTASSGPARPSRSRTSGPWRRRRSSPRSSPDPTARTVPGRWKRNGSSAPRAATGCAACAPTAAAWWSSTGPCAPGAARTSSDRRSWHRRTCPARSRSWWTADAAPGGRSSPSGARPHDGSRDDPRPGALTAPQLPPDDCILSWTSSSPPTRSRARTWPEPPLRPRVGRPVVDLHPRWQPGPVAVPRHVAVQCRRHRGAPDRDPGTAVHGSLIDVPRGHRRPGYRACRWGRVPGGGPRERRRSTTTARRRSCCSAWCSSSAPSHRPGWGRRPGRS